MSQELELDMVRMCGVPLQGFGQSPPGACAGSKSGGILPLALLGPGSSGRISFLRGPSDMLRHITELGFVEGAEVKVVSGNFGNLIIELKGSRLAFGREMATHIVVTR